MNNAKVFKTWLMLKITYSLVPILLGLDKCFTSWIVDWSKYVSPEVMAYSPFSLAHFLTLVGVIEIVAGIIVWFYPRFGAYLVIAWLGLIIINLATLPGMYDIIARDAVIALGALALAWLTEATEEK
jgi:hypothetical protein